MRKTSERVKHTNDKLHTEKSFGNTYHVADMPHLRLGRVGVAGQEQRALGAAQRLRLAPLLDAAARLLGRGVDVPDEVCEALEPLGRPQHGGPQRNLVHLKALVLPALQLPRGQEPARVLEEAHIRVDAQDEPRLLALVRLLRQLLEVVGHDDLLSGCRWEC